MANISNGYKKPTYPWDTWFKKSKFILVRGKDFKCQVHGMVGQIRNIAGSRKVKVTIHVSGHDGVEKIVVTKKG